MARGRKRQALSHERIEILQALQEVVGSELVMFNQVREFAKERGMEYPFWITQKAHATGVRGQYSLDKVRSFRTPEALEAANNRPSVLKSKVEVKVEPEMENQESEQESDQDELEPPLMVS